jgi:hypothetical protein
MRSCRVARSKASVLHAWRQAARAHMLDRTFSKAANTSLFQPILHRWHESSAGYAWHSEKLVVKAHRHHNRHLLRSAFHFWCNNIRLRRHLISLHFRADRMYRRARLSTSFNTWLQALVDLRRERLNTTKAYAHRQRIVKGRVWGAWAYLVDRIATARQHVRLSRQLETRLLARKLVSAVTQWRAVTPSTSAFQSSFNKISLMVRIHTMRQHLKAWRALNQQLAKAKMLNRLAYPYSKPKKANSAVIPAVVKNGAHVKTTFPAKHIVIHTSAWRPLA